MTVKWLSQTPNPPRIPVFYTLTKIHKPTPVGRPIVAGNDGPTERISSFVDSLLQPIAKSQKSYLKDTTDFVNFIERRNLPEDAFLVSLDVASASLYTNNIPQEEGINTVCKSYWTFYHTCQLSRLRCESHAGSRLRANFSRLTEKCELLPSCLTQFPKIC